MKGLKIGLVFLLAFFLVGVVWAKDPSTRDNRKLFGYNVEGLKPVKLLMVSDAPFGSIGDVLALVFQRMVQEESKGKIQIDHHRFGSLYTAKDLPKVLPLGTVDLGTINKGYLMTKAPGYVPWVIAYIWKSPEHMLALTGSKEWYEMEDSLAAKYWKLKPLSHVAYGNWDYWANKDIKTMDDFKGTRFWSYGELSNAYILGWGGTPEILARAEMNMSYLKKALTGISSSSPAYLDGKYYEAGKYWLHMPTYPPGSVGFHYVQLYMNLNKWESLPEAYKRILLDAADVYSWNSIWEYVILEKASEYQLIHDHGVIDVGIATKTPKEYERICDAAVEAGRKYGKEKRGVSDEVWNNALAIRKKYGDPKLDAEYTWWYKLAWAEADRVVNQAKKRIAAGEPKAKVWDSYHPKRYYDMPYAKVREEWLKTPRCVRDWPIDMRLK
jgi:TRAP-type C4-dicarboxylate transport system substrate-binding protein